MKKKSEIKGSLPDSTTEATTPKQPLHKDEGFWAIVGGLFVSLILFGVSMLDGSPRDILSLLAAILAIMFAVMLGKKALGK